MMDSETNRAAIALWEVLSPEIVPGSVIALATCPNESYARLVPLLLDAARAHGVRTVRLPASEPAAIPAVQDPMADLLQRIATTDREMGLVLTEWAALATPLPALADAARRHGLCIMLLGDIDLVEDASPSWADLPAEIRAAARAAFVLSAPRFDDHAADDEIPSYFLSDLYRLGPEREATPQLRLVTPTVDARIPIDVA
jgi:hypothetical protein